MTVQTAQTAETPAPSDDESTVLVEIRGDARRQLCLARDVTTIGRSPDNVLAIQDRLVSKRHAEIRRLPDGSYEIVDQKSSFGLFVNKKRVARHILSDGDHILLGSTEFEFHQQSREPYPKNRRHTRIQCNLSVRARNNGTTMDTRGTDISLGGMRLAWPHPVEVGAEFHLEIAFPGRWRRIRLRARATHRTGGTSIGLVFVFKSQRQQLELSKAFAKLFITQAAT